MLIVWASIAKMEAFVSKGFAIVSVDSPDPDARRVKYDKRIKYDRRVKYA